MRVFVTGATGHVGSAVASAFRDAGHDVAALARSDASAQRLAAAGLEPVPGTLGDPGTFASVAGASDVVVHAGFEYAASGEERGDVDEVATVAMLTAAREGAADGRPRHLIYTSNAYLLRSPAAAVDESVDTDGPTIPPAWRFAVERRVLGAASAERSAPVRTAVVRLGLVYGGDGGSGPSLFAAALRHGAGVHASPATARMSLIYRRDLAELYVRIAAAAAPGVFHAVDGCPLTTAEVARAVSTAAGFGGRTEELADAAAVHALGPHTVDIMRRDVAVLPTRSFALGWRPRFTSFREGAATALEEWRAGAR